ncbi:uncharacterized protein BO88DRAFT_458442 [Aspergillus vadensis CBS 113365]|uniref:Uncharacterized protein n=1 Tax=Aspergillus vadensis (strain CBS 113365 / IMI 142717 / IBT 24658) TaxID=1448311 RepID=A0A319AUT0_ASPVC|nr:hypothetical protein BO88DRAFT_458442 [Aspergillus vadensis CBS 113365]PYH64117.1 hypothetical protein BO88DRAFT_458442 [Aspergillus vadensis CBS 113365]
MPPKKSLLKGYGPGSRALWSKTSSCATCSLTGFACARTGWIVGEARATSRWNYFHYHQGSSSDDGLRQPPQVIPRVSPEAKSSRTQVSFRYEPITMPYITFSRYS